jgi:hypothetical protein
MFALKYPNSNYLVRSDATDMEWILSGSGLDITIARPPN